MDALSSYCKEVLFKVTEPMDKVYLEKTRYGMYMAKLVKNNQTVAIFGEESLEQINQLWTI